MDMDMCWVMKNLSHQVTRFHLRVNKWHLAFLFKLSYCKQVSFSKSTWCRDFNIFVFLVTSLFKMALKHSAEVLSSVP